MPPGGPAVFNVPSIQIEPESDTVSFSSCIKPVTNLMVRQSGPFFWMYPKWQVSFLFLTSGHYFLYYQEAFTFLSSVATKYAVDSRSI